MDVQPNSASSAVVFAYHDVGVRCLEALLELGVDIRLVVTHQDNLSEEIWFASVQASARRNNIPVITPENPNTPEVLRQIAECKPDFLFSFYYRLMLGEDVLEIPEKGAFNVHGSLLPAYRGRVPVNWAIIHGEKESGVSLHRMERRPDAGNLLAQKAVPILSNDTAFDVFQKITCAAESMLLEIVPEMINGSVVEAPLDLSRGSYFSGRKPQDGRIDWSRPARDIHNLIRAVAPPYPGAFFDTGDHRIELLGSYYRCEKARSPIARIYWENEFFRADCVDGRRFMITEMRISDAAANLSSFTRLFGEQLVLENNFDDKNETNSSES